MAENEKNKKIRGEDAMVTNNLPEDIIFDLLSKLPVKSLLRWRCVCKSWCAVIDRPDLVKMHLTRSIATSSNLSLVSVPFKRYMGKEDPVRIISVDLDDCEQEREAAQGVEFGCPFPIPEEDYLLISCNGLVYMFHNVTAFEVKLPTFLLNPSTSRHKKLPFMRLDFPSNTLSAQDTAYGFGYDPTTQDYKVIRVLEFSVDDDDADNINYIGFEVKVYWRRIEGIPSFGVHHHSVGVFKNSAFHWVSRPKTTTVPTSSVIVSVDIKEDEYREMPLPDLVANDFDMTMTVGVLGEKHQLCVICVSFRVHVELWVMKDYGVRDSWEKLFLIEQPPPSDYFNNYIRPICYSKNGELLLETSIFTHAFLGALLLYDPHKGSLSKLMSCGLREAVCIGNLVSLDTKMEPIN